MEKNLILTCAFKSLVTPNTFVSYKTLCISYKKKLASFQLCSVNFNALVSYFRYFRLAIVITNGFSVSSDYGVAKLRKISKTVLLRDF